MTPARWKDFEALFGPRGACAGCWCQWPRNTRAMNVERQGDGGKANKRAMKKLVDSGRPPGLLAYAGGEAVAWMALAPREEYLRLKTSRAAKPLDDRKAWAAPCFFTAKAYRGKGAMAALLKAGAAYAKKRGAKLLEGYPYDTKGEKVADAWLWWGTPKAFKAAGFREAGRNTPARPVMRRAL